MSRASQRLQRTFEQRYVLALGLLAIAATVSFVTSYRLALIETDRAQAVVLATEQRALSQRVAFLVKALDAANEPRQVDQLRHELELTLDRMTLAHATLTGNSRESERLSRFITPLEGIYANGYWPFDVQVVEFLENGRIIAATDRLSSEWAASDSLRTNILSAATSSMLQTHGLMVRILEAEAKKDVSVMKLVDIILFVSTASLLLLVFGLIFRPMRDEITKAFDAVEGAQAQAKDAKNQAEAANEAKGNFFQTASHEIRTPLNAILGLSDVLKEQSDGSLDEELEQISAAGDHLLSLLNNILDVQKIADGDLTISEREFRPSETLERISKLAESLAKSKGLSFKKEVDIPEELKVSGDAGRLEQVIVNVIDNAVKFTEEGSIELHAHIDDPDKDRSNLHVAICDSGIGISPEQMDQIFADITSQKPDLSRNGGLGVGLAVAREVVRLMGGTIDAESGAENGSRFIITIPLDVTEPAELEKDGVAEEIAEGALKERVVSRREFSVLIVDDNMANRMVAEALLKPLGATATMAADGKQAVQKAEEREFDVIFMDISMPVMDGIEATVAIRGGDGPNAATPIIALTAHVDASEVGSLQAKGFQDIINKPVRKETLAMAVETYLPAPPLHKQEAASSGPPGEDSPVEETA